MFRDARREVLVSSFSVDAAGPGRTSLFAPLHAVMREHGVVAHIFYDVERCADAARTTRSTAADASTFLKLYWPFGFPVPRLYHDPRALDPESHASMHAKMVVADRRWVLVGSANLTDRGATRNIELGVKLDDATLAEQLVAHWRGAVHAGTLRASG
jgi:phosphatidylserine/phosphatidylglycerophosphate/cardiolipin synthase-like enzyme